MLCACGAQHYEATEPQAHSSENILTPADLVRSTDSAVTTGSSDIFVNTVSPTRKTFSVDVRLLVTNEDGTDEVIELEAQAVTWTHNYAEPLLNVVNAFLVAISRKSGFAPMNFLCLMSIASHAL